MKGILNTALFICLHSALIGQPAWTQKAGYGGSPRYSFAGFAANGYGYIGGGRFGGPFNAQSDWQHYDPAANTWAPATAMVYPYTALTAFSVGAYGYVANGVNDITYNYETFKYNPAGNNWSVVAPVVYPRLYAAACANATHGFVVGGYGFAAEPLNDLWKYDPVADTWTEMTALPLTEARYNATAFSVNQLVFLFGGIDDITCRNDLWEYDPATDQWSAKTPMPAQGRQYCFSFVLGNEAYVAGGSDCSGAGLNEVWKYTPATDSWTQLPDFPGANSPQAGASFVINGKAYIVCANGTNECWEYDPGSTLAAEPAAPGTPQLFPNPVNSVSTLLLPAAFGDKVKVSFFDSTGRLIIEQVTNNGMLEIRKNGFAAGMYSMLVQNDSGSHAQIRMLVQ